ncbi:MAG: RnfABCDGE type electron transport complex subunit D [Tissierellia bacterium]|nr:RnfABCDGE type electron transport complex subunit D [Tissierellia bacterium]
MFSFYDKLFQKQKMMRTVLIALAPIIIYSVYLYGWRALALVAFNMLVATIVEYLSETKIYKRKKVTEAVLVTAVLFTLTLPPAIPFWISAVGISFGVFFGKMLFGGFGKNVFNPALVGRAFIYVNFPLHLTIYWNQAMNGTKLFNGLGGFTHWLTPMIDDVSSATPMMAFRNLGESLNNIQLLFGNIPGAVGETSKVLILLAAAYLIYKKVASWEIMLANVVGFTALTLIFNLMGVSSIPNPIEGMLMGGFLFGAVFMATDPISAPKTKIAKWLYGILIGCVVVIIRGFALFSGGMMFAVLIGNTFGPIIDYVANKVKQNKKNKAVA